jgi:hypothetical protein
MSEDKQTADLDAILSGEIPAQEPVSQQTPPEQQPPEGQAEAETGDKEQDAAPPAVPPVKDEGPHVPRKALEDERRKRQELERQIADLTSKAAPPTAQPQTQQPVQQQPRQMPKRPDPWTDPEGAAAYDQMMLQHQLFETRVVTSQELMKATKPDFDEINRIFIEAASSDPYLEQQLVQHPLPAKFAYEQGKRIKLMREIGDDPDAYEKRLREKWEAERADQQQPQPQPVAPAAPKSLASTASTQPRLKNGQFAGAEHASLDDILGG